MTKELDIRIAIGMIVKDEFDSLIEWVAYHRVAGFDDFFIADNGSTDGTRELLEALQNGGVVNLIYQPSLSKSEREGSVDIEQYIAYARICEVAIQKCDVLLFIDADEFILYEGLKECSERMMLEKIFSDPDVGSVSINWRCFGSSGQEKLDGRLVIERFVQCANDNNLVNRHVKSAYRLPFLDTKRYSVNPHSGIVVGSKRTINVCNHVLENGTAITTEVCSGPLRVNHYVIKSREEFEKKRQKWGERDRRLDEEFFKAHDFKDNVFLFSGERIGMVKEEINRIKEIISNTCYFDTLVGHIDCMDAFNVSGWVSRLHGTSKGLYVSIFVNGIHQGLVPCQFYREDVKATGLSADGLCGFRFTFPKPLKPEDKVDVFVYGNRFRFPECRVGDEEKQDE
jgi:glycosyltransferase involved in cell wall biosynthesis